ncbi:MAG: hypothetical protein ACRDY0_08575 [Acidimicrobiales bacterium]
MTIVWRCETSVESYAAAGKDVEVPRPLCPTCCAWMVFWSGYWRQVRVVETWQIWVRRARCPGCRVSDALLPSFCLVRRRDTAEVIAEAVVAVAGGAGMRPVAARAGVARSTARGWWQRHRERARAALGLVVILATGFGAVMVIPDAPPEAVALFALSAVASGHQGLAWGPSLSLSTGGSWLITTSRPSPWPRSGPCMVERKPGEPKGPP